MKQHFQNYPTKPTDMRQLAENESLTQEQASGKQLFQRYPILKIANFLGSGALKFAALKVLTKRIAEKDNRGMIEILKKYPRLIYRINSVKHIFSPQWGIFRIFLVNNKYLLYKADKLIFSSYNREIVQLNLKEWRYYFEREQKNKSKSESPPN